MEWNNHYRSTGIDVDRICKDGIIDPVAYEKADSKILFILKDTNKYRGDLRELLHDGPRFQMWHALARWAAGIQLGFPQFEEIDKPDVMRTAFRSCAVINLKKTTGKAQANMSVINAYAHQDRRLLHKQIDEIKPDGIVACGTFDQMLWLLDLDCDPDSPT
ncbi:MAG: hypothetical protein IID14_06690, partial [Candidatus Marinimicrobia bacterium]|nr:hypothetical protein [Candidatus Neomarinimicrobiota bacterium]